MTLSAADRSELAELAIVAATEAGQMIASSRPADVAHKANGASRASQVVTEVDVRSEEVILHVLEPTLEQFNLGLLAEERVDDGGRLAADYFWCIDPLDGTLAFVEGIPGYAVSIALVGRDGTPWIGVVYDPVEATLLHAIRGAGAFRNNNPWSKLSPPAGQVLSIFADRSFTESDSYATMVEALEQIAQDMGLNGVQIHATAGAVMNACGVLANAPACYFKTPKTLGGGSLWDFAATALLFNELGAVATDMHGEPLDLNRADSTLMGHRGVLFATDQTLAERIRTL